MIAYRNGTPAAEDRHVTSGAPARLVLTQDTFDVRANGADVALVTCSVRDENGNEVPDAACEVSFSCGGNCSVYSTGSDISDHTSLFSPVRKMRAGKITVAVRLGTAPEGMRLYATANGLKTACLCLTVKE